MNLEKHQLTLKISISLLLILLIPNISHSRGTDLGNNGDDVRLTFFHGVFIAQDILEAYQNDKRFIKSLANDGLARWFDEDSMTKTSLIQKISTTDHVWTRTNQASCAKTKPEDDQTIYLSFSECKKLNLSIFDAAKIIIESSAEILALPNGKGSGGKLVKTWQKAYPSITNQMNHPPVIASPTIQIPVGDVKGSYYAQSLRSSDTGDDLSISKDGEVILNEKSLHLEEGASLRFPLLMIWDSINKLFKVNGIYEQRRPDGRLCTPDAWLYLVPSEDLSAIQANLDLPILDDSSCKVTGNKMKYFDFQKR